MTEPPLTVESFFGANWTGRGEVASLFRHTLRSFDVSYRSVVSGEDGVLLSEERIVYDHGATLDRSWHLSREGRGFLGLEPLQGGRMRVENTRRGISIRYDRLRLTPGQNVTRLSVHAVWTPDGKVRMQGWTRIFGAIPLVRTQVLLTPSAPATPAATGLRPASR